MAFTALIQKEGNLYVAKAAEFEIASQGRNAKEALSNLKEAVGLYGRTYADGFKVEYLEVNEG